MLPRASRITSWSHSTNQFHHRADLVHRGDVVPVDGVVHDPHGISRFRRWIRAVTSCSTWPKESAVWAILASKASVMSRSCLRTKGTRARIWLIWSCSAANRRGRDRHMGRGTHAPLLLDGDADVLGLQELIASDRAALTAQARFLDAAEGGGGVGHHALVQRD